MLFNQLEQKFSDRFRDLFQSGWAGAADSLVTILISIWLYASAWAYIYSPSRKVQSSWPRLGPLAWWRTQLAQVGIHFPHWLGAITDWHTLDGRVVLLALTLGAIGATIGLRRSNAPGFSIIALLALTLNAQWFGLGRALKTYMVLVLILVAAVSVRAGWSWLTDHRQAPIMRNGMYFSFNTILCGMLDGPLRILLMPVLYPIILLLNAVAAFGLNLGKLDNPDAAQLLDNELRELEGSGMMLNEVSAAKAARLMAAIKLASETAETQQKAIRVLSRRGPTGARPVVPVINASQSGWQTTGR